MRWGTALKEYKNEGENTDKKEKEKKLTK